MHPKLQNILDIIQQSDKLEAEQKDKLLKAVKDADKELEITAFKLERTEKVKKHTAILLEETIEELEQKRKAVEEQNRELEVEACLERVRASAMAMKKPDDMVEVCRIISDQLKLLGVNDIRNVQTAIINEEKGTYLNYQYFTAYDNGIVEETEYNKHPKVHEMVRTIKKSADAFFKGSFEGEELEIFREYRKKDNQFPDPFLDEATAVHYNFYSIGLGGLGLTTYNPVPQGELDIFKRFHKVFSLAYKRFIDIQLAEAQAHEAQIEAALEKVRSRSLAMRFTDELQEVVTLVAEKLLELGVIMDAGGVIICTYFQNSKDVLHWMATPDFSNSKPYLLPFFDHPIFNEAWNSKESGEEFFSNSYTRELKNSFFLYAFENSDYKYFPDEFKELILASEYHALTFAWAENSAILIPSFTPISISEKNKKIMLRFARVFEQAYIRFLDLQKAEEQAREARIAASLEKVRARAMAMHSSEELTEVSLELRKQMGLLGQKDLEVCAIHLYEEDEKYFESWGAVKSPGDDDKLFLGVAKFPKSGIEIVDEMMNHYSAGDKDYVLVNEGPKALEWLDVMKKYAPEAYEMILHKIENTPSDELKSFWSVSDFSGGALVMVTYTPPDENSRNLLSSSAAVFGLAYRRYKDLKIAEAQNKIIQAENERKTQELEEARELQLAMLPKSIPRLRNYELEVYMKTATEVGGDYYDFSIKQNGSINIAIGDATGHGMKAGTMVTMIKSLFTANSRTEDITEFFSSTNEAIKNSNLKRMMVAFAMLNIYGKSLKVINAGMPPVYYYKNYSKEIIELGGNNLPLGAMHNIKYKADEIEMNQGDLVLMLSDGFPELQNEKDELYGYERLLNTLTKIGNESADEIINTLKNEGSNWLNDGVPDDDVTFVVIKVK